LVAHQEEGLEVRRRLLLLLLLLLLPVHQCGGAGAVRMVGGPSVLGHWPQH
jgi:hypothetical protein